jgi:ornithine cyclodeaminase/alanine dehydrogenase-like protein (mu-crystallin family)
MSLVFLSRAEIARLMPYADYVDALEMAFRAAESGAALAPPAAAFHVPGGGYHAKAAALLSGDLPVMAIKLNGNYPGNPARHKLPTVQGVIYLADATNGRPLALMDSIEVTINRTGAATTLAARHLARADAKIATICGAGVQGRIQLTAIAAAAKLERVHIWDIDRAAAVRLAAEMAARLELPVAASGLDAARESDIVVTCSSARQPFLTPDLVRPGTFIAAVGADNDDKSEIAPALYARAQVTVDSLEQCAEIGDLHHALAAKAVTRSHIYATLGEVVSGKKPGRMDAGAITLFDSTGMGLQDVAAAAIYRRARAQNAGARLAL